MISDSVPSRGLKGIERQLGLNLIIIYSFQFGHLNIMYVYNYFFHIDNLEVHVSNNFVKPPQVPVLFLPF